jgi:hypothetical protein
VRWKESINHPSHFRISLAPSDAQFVDPTGYDDKDGGPNVLVDDIEDTGGPSGTLYEQQVTLPNEPCPTCVLQLIQVMTDKEPWNGDDIYYQCADLVIEGGAVSPTGGTGGVATSGGGSVGVGGTLATGGAFPATGGVPATGGTGGTFGSGGVVASGGAVATGGAVTGLPTGGQSFDDGGDDSDDTSGGCQANWAGVDPTGPSALLWLVLGGLTIGRFRRRWE